MNIILRVVHAACNLHVRVALKLGYVDYVYGLSNGPWSEHGSQPSSILAGKNNAAFDATKLLIERHGFHRCPSCTWATKKPNAHFMAGGWCQEHHEEQIHQKNERMFWHLTFLNQLRQLDPARLPS